MNYLNLKLRKNSKIMNKQWTIDNNPKILNPKVGNVNNPNF